MGLTTFRISLTTLLAFFSLTLLSNGFYDKDEVQARLEKMECIVEPRYTTEVESYIKGYFARDAYKAKLILARTVTYFPIFEKYLSEHNMPDDLKYLAVVESALNPKAVSRVGATGLWQFMKETGTVYGLKINREIDERSCPNRSTIAAMEYLSRAYERFGSWELAIASYNCGAGNVLRAMKRSGGSKDFWKISRYLPRETRNFVPAFLGAAYMIKYHHLHDAAPEYNHLDLQLTESELFYNEMPFETIAAVAEIPVSVVETLNPAYKKGYVPSYENGHWVVLPRRSMQALRDYVALTRPDNGSASELPPLPELVAEEDYAPSDYYNKSYYTSLKDDKLDELGKLFHCSAYHLKVWNNLRSEQLSRKQELLVWFPKELKRFPHTEKIEVLPPKTRLTKKPGNVRPQQPKVDPVETIKLAPLTSRQHAHLPFSAMPSLPLTETKPAWEQKNKKLDLQQIKAWALEKPFFKKNKGGKKKGD